MKTIAILMLTSVLSFNVMADGPKDKDKAADKYCAKIKDGKVTVMHEGKPITSDVTLNDGTQIRIDGTVVKKDGSQTKMKEGQCYNMDGKVEEKGIMPGKSKTGSKDKDMNDKDKSEYPK